MRNIAMTTVEFSLENTESNFADLYGIKAPNQARRQGLAQAFPSLSHKCFSQVFSKGEGR